MRGTPKSLARRSRSVATRRRRSITARQVTAARGPSSCRTSRRRGRPPGIPVIQRLSRSIRSRSSAPDGTWETRFRSTGARRREDSTDSQAVLVLARILELDSGKAGNVADCRKAAASDLRTALFSARQACVRAGSLRPPILPHEMSFFCDKKMRSVAPAALRWSRSGPSDAKPSLDQRRWMVLPLVRRTKPPSSNSSAFARKAEKRSRVSSRSAAASPLSAVTSSGTSAPPSRPRPARAS